MPLKYWDEAFLAATYLINQTPTKHLSYDTPLQKLLGATPDYSSFCVFGYACWPNLHPYNPYKLELPSTKCIFMGYSNMHKGFKCLDISKGHIYISRDVIFDDPTFLFTSLHSNASTHYPSDVLLILGDNEITNRTNIPFVSTLPVLDLPVQIKPTAPSTLPDPLPQPILGSPPLASTCEMCGGPDTSAIGSNVGPCPHMI
jgi:hypothetical protein